MRCSCQVNFTNQEDEARSSVSLPKGYTPLGSNCLGCNCLTTINKNILDAYS